MDVMDAPRALGAREAALLRGVPHDARILELGPSMAPVAPRSAGWNVTVVDHATQEELVEKYRHDVHVDVTRIEAVDHVWHGGPLHEAVPAELHGGFDMLIASHVIEHIPDPVRFLQSARRLLHPERGVLALAVPDKRWCFDALKQVSTTGQMLEAYLQKRQRHSAQTRFDTSAYIAFDGTRSIWGREPLPDLYLPDTLEQSFQQFKDWSDAPEAPYVDCHAWHFTPASFRLVILELAGVGLCDWHVDWLEPQAAVEFLTQLRPGAERFASAKARDGTRLGLMRQVLLELAEQADVQFRGLGPPAAPGADVPGLPAERAERQFTLVQQILTDLRQRIDAGCFDQQARQELRQAAEAAAMLRAALRPSRAVWRGILPLRRVVARLRGRA